MTRRTAQQIVDQLFRNGQGQEATRLVLELPDKRDGGGWCKEAVIDLVSRILREAQ